MTTVDHPAHGVHQVVVHLRSPLSVARTDEPLAVSGRAAKVDLDAEVAAIGQPLRLRVEAPGVARPGAAVDVQDCGQPTSLWSCRKAEVTADGQPVASPEREGLHTGQRAALELRPVREEEPAMPRAAVKGEVGDGPIVR